MTKVKNPETTVTLTAYDATGEVVDKTETFGRYSPELQYLDFATNAMAKYKAVRIVMEVAMALLIALNLSYAPAEAGYGNDKYIIAGDVDVSGRNCTAVTNVYSMCRTVPSPWYTQYPPIRYAEIWNNPLNQTAQQYVAILSMVQQEGTEVNRVIKRAREKLNEINRIDKIRSGMVIDQFGPKFQEQRLSAQIPFALGLALLASGGFVLLLVDHARLAKKATEKSKKEEGDFI